MMGIWVVTHTFSPRFQDWRSYAPILALFATFQVWVGVQHLSLPIELLQVVAPANAKSYLALNSGVDSATLSLDPSQTHVGFIKGLSYWCLLFLVVVLVNTPGRLKALAVTMVLTGTVQACYGVLLTLSGAETTWILGLPNPNIANGSFLYRNHFGNFLVLCLCQGIGLLIASLSASGSRSFRARLQNAIAMILNGKAAVRLCLAMMVIGLVMSRSRMANVAFFASLAVAGLAGLWLIRKKSLKLTLLLASLLVIDLAILGSWFGMDELKQRLQSTSLAVEQRVEVNQYSQILVERYPLTGTGGGSFYSSFPGVKGPGVDLFYDHAHNDYLQFALEFGLPACVLLGVAIALSVYNSLVALRQRRNSLMQGIAFASLMAVTAELIQLTTDFHLQAPATAVYFLLCLILAWKARFMPVRDNP